MQSLPVPKPVIVDNVRSTQRPTETSVLSDKLPEPLQDGPIQLLRSFGMMQRRVLFIVFEELMVIEVPWNRDAPSIAESLLKKLPPNTKA